MLRRRPIKADSHIYCDVHGAIHPTEKDYYEDGTPDCAPNNWRPVYVLGEPGESF